MFAPDPISSKVRRTLSCAIHSLLASSDHLQAGDESSHDDLVREVARRNPELIHTIESHPSNLLAVMNLHFSEGLSLEYLAKSKNLKLDSVETAVRYIKSELRRMLSESDSAMRETLVRDVVEGEILEGPSNLQLLEESASRLEGKGFHALVEFLNEFPDYAPSPDLIEAFVDSSYFWHSLLTSERPSIQKLIRDIGQEHFGLKVHLMGEAQHESFQLYLRHRFSTIDDIESDEMLALALGHIVQDIEGGGYAPLKNSGPAIAREILTRFYLPYETATLPPFVVNGRLSYLFNPEVMGHEAIILFRRKVPSIATLLDFPKKPELLQAFGLPKKTTRAQLSLYLTTHPTSEAPYLSPLLPKSTRLAENERELYFDPKWVGEVAATRNHERYAEWEGKK
ncbi:MAG: hypothetical protein KDD55_08665 [Bdellovibrionales bacterium]|nr:hypothetical protein [Bdellovibrionales bacterium]